MTKDERITALTEALTLNSERKIGGQHCWCIHKPDYPDDETDHEESCQIARRVLYGDGKPHEAGADKCPHAEMEIHWLEQANQWRERATALALRLEAVRSTLLDQDYTYAGDLAVILTRVLGGQSIDLATWFSRTMREVGRQFKVHGQTMPESVWKALITRALRRPPRIPDPPSEPSDLA